MEPQENENSGKPKPKISTLGWFWLLFLASVADLLSLIPFVGAVSSPIFWAYAGYYFWKKGMGFINGKRIATGVLSIVAEAIPVLQALPFAIAGIAIIFLITKIEEKTGISIAPVVGGKKPLNAEGMRRAVAKPSPLNQNGVRMPYGGLKPPA
jgi:hypothetical protein